ncbi:MAG TPA: multicopper oxidase family protein [Candidatus Cybelea sp.]
MLVNDWFVRLAAPSLLFLGLLVASGCNRQAAAPPAPFEIPVVRAQHGVVSFELTAVVDPSTGAPAFAYAGTVGSAPTIRLRPGDEIRVKLTNHLPSGTDAPNLINLHFHGLEVSPYPPSDDAMRLAAPGESLDYDVHVSREQPPGLYWYHSHAHGQTYWQITSGMSGAIVVEGLQQHLPALAAMRERIIMLRNVQTPPDYDGIPIAARPEPNRSKIIAARKRAGRFTLVDSDDSVGQPCASTPGLGVTMNGAPRRTIGIDPGEWQLFRVVNASAGRYFDLQVDGEQLTLVALDGFPLDAFAGSPPVQFLSHIVVAPAGRAEFLVRGLSHPTVMRSRCYVSGEAGDRDPEVVLADLRTDGGAPPGAMSSPDLRRARPLPRSPRAARLPAIAATRHIIFTEDVDGFYINGRKFHMGDPPSVVAHAGTVERWVLINKTDEVHDFHIHQVHFAVESIDGRATRPLHWVDTVTVPPMRYTHTAGTPGAAIVLMDFRNPAIRGTFVYHCHILDHEDGGMMASIRVI